MYREYDPKDLVINYGGVQISGYADGDFLSIVPAGEANAKVIGADGEIGRSKTNDLTYEVTVTLLATSTSNTVLSALFAANQALPLIIAHINGQTLFSAAQAWIRQMADGTFGKEIGERAWVFDTGQVSGINYILGGGEAI